MHLAICTLILLSLIAIGEKAFRFSANRCALIRKSVPLYLLFFAFLPAVSSNAQTQGNVVTESDTIGVKVYFRQGYSLLQPAFRENGVRLDASNI